MVTTVLKSSSSIPLKPIFSNKLYRAHVSVGKSKKSQINFIDESRIMSYQCVKYFLFTYLVARCMGSDMFSALSDIKPLLKTQQSAIESLEYYVVKQKEKLDIIVEYLEAMKAEQEMAESISSYLHNPINSFTLLKRLTHDLDFLESLIYKEPEYNKNLVVRYPSKDDLIGAAKGFVRIQTTYELNVTDLSRGLLKSHYNEKREESLHYFKPMSFDECYVLGATLCESENYSEALEWLLESYHKLLDNNYENRTPYKLEHILGHIVSVYIELNDCHSAKSLAEYLIKIDPSLNYDLQLQECVKKNKKNDQSIDHSDFDLNKKNEIENEEQTKDKTRSNSPTWGDSYQKCCRGEMDIAPEVKHRLKCRYFYETHPFLLLAPFKMEELYLEPDVYIFYDVISDEEIKKVQQDSLKKLKRSKVKTADGSKPSNVRISKTAWLDGKDCRVLDKLFDRVTDMTGYDLYFSSQFQIANYGIGGHFDVHYDFFNPSDKKSVSMGNRIATVLLYISDVEQGGATVFTKLGLTMFPIKGAAVIWKNLLPDGQGNPSLMHGACPVLLGDKWGINLWIREHAQELIEPCPLDPKQGMTSKNLGPVQWTRY